MDKFYSMVGMCKKAGFIISGETGCIQSIKKSKCKLLILASDASDNTKDRFIGLCRRNNIKIITAGSKAELGNAIGKSYTATISVIDERFSNALLEAMSKCITCK